MLDKHLRNVTVYLHSSVLKPYTKTQTQKPVTPKPTTPKPVTPKPKPKNLKPQNLKL